MTRAWCLAILCAATAGGCGPGGAAENLGSCNSTVGDCLDYEAFPGGAGAVQGTCTAPGVYSPGLCPATGRVGRCRVAQGGAVRSTYVVNTYAPATAAEAQQGCQACVGSGATCTWIP